MEDVLGTMDWDYDSLIAEAEVSIEESLMTASPVMTTEVINLDEEEMPTLLQIPVMDAKILEAPKITELVKHQGLVHVKSGLKGRLSLDINVQGTC